MSKNISRAEYDAIIAAFRPPNGMVEEQFCIGVSFDPFDGPPPSNVPPAKLTCKGCHEIVYKLHHHDAEVLKNLICLGINSVFDGSRLDTIWVDMKGAEVARADPYTWSQNPDCKWHGAPRDHGGASGRLEACFS